MKQLKEIFTKYWLLFVVINTVAFTLAYNYRNYVQVYNTQEGQFIIQDGHMYQLNLIALELVGEE